MTFDEWIEKKLSREQERNIPKFSNCEEAVEYFQEKYKDKFRKEDSFVVGNQRCYHFVIVFDEDAYKKGRKELKKSLIEINTDDYLFSYQAVEISENGEVQIVH